MFCMLVSILPGFLRTETDWNSMAIFFTFISNINLDWDFVYRTFKALLYLCNSFPWLNINFTHKLKILSLRSVKKIGYWYLIKTQYLHVNNVKDKNLRKYLFCLLKLFKWNQCTDKMFLLYRKHGYNGKHLLLVYALKS